VDGSNDMVGAVAGDTTGFNGTGESMIGNNDVLYEAAAGTSVTVDGNDDTVGAVAGDTTGFSGTGESMVGDDDTVYLASSSAAVTVSGDSDLVNSAYSGNVIGFAGNADTAQINNGQIDLDNASTSVTVEGNSDTVNSGYSGDTVGLTGTNDLAQVSDGTIDVNGTSASSLTLDGTDDTATIFSGTTQGAPVLDSQTVDDIDAIYNAVLDRDPAPADLVATQMELADGGSLSGLMSQLANSAEAQSDMDSTYAAAAGSYQALLDAQPQSFFQLANVDDVQDQNTGTPTQTEFNAFADAMSTSYGAPIEVLSIDPFTGVQTELADTSITNLLAELPVLETQANGTSLFLQLADGTPMLFASTAQLATFLYSLAVQQMQATSFVTDNYNLDMQWLGTVDQPLLQEAEYWSERATAEASSHPEQAIEDNTQASMALQIAAEAPGSRQDMEVTINNAATGNPTQITVFADGDGSTIHDVAPSIGGYIEEAVSTLVDIAAVVSGQYYLYLAAAGIDAIEAGQAFSSGEDVQGLLSLAEAVSAGISGGTGGTTPLGTTSTVSPTTLQTAAQVINVAAEGVGGVYGTVQSAENGNAVGILSGALEAAAAAAAGIGIDDGPGQAQQTLNLISAALGAASVGTNMGSDFASGNLAQGLIDSLNLYLPAEALANANYQNNSAQVQQPLQMDAAALAAAGTNPAPNINIPNFAAAANSPTPVASGTGSSGVTVTVAPVGAGGVANVDNTLGTGGTAVVMTQNGQTYLVAATPASSADTIQAALSGVAADVMWFLGYVNPIGTAEAAPALTPTETTLAQQIDTYLTTNAPNSPLSGMGSTIVADSVLYGVDPRLLVAVAGAETGYGTNITAGANNIFNNLYSGLNSPFDSVDSAILNEAKMIGRSNGYYFGQGLTTTASFYSTYCQGAACGTGLTNLNNFLNALGGNVNNLRWTGQ
jgi:hypothetical protein